jgi:hypothetical protein
VLEQLADLPQFLKNLVGLLARDFPGSWLAGGLGVQALAKPAPTRRMSQFVKSFSLHS